MIRDVRTATCDACGKESVSRPCEEGVLDQRAAATGEPWRGMGFHRCSIPVLSKNAAYYLSQKVDLCGECWKRFRKKCQAFFSRGGSA